MLRGLRFNLVSCGNVGHQRAMHENDVSRDLLIFELTRGFNERLGFNVAHGAADFRNNEIGLRALGNTVKLAFNGIGHVGNYLHRAAQKISVAFAGDELLVNGTLREVRFAQQILVNEALIMSQVKVAFVAVFGNENLTVLKRAHGAGVNVQVRIHLLHHYGITACFQQMPQ